MRKLKFTILFFCAVLMSGSEEVIDVDLDDAEPRLVVDAALKWQKGTQGNEQIIKLSTTAPYFSDEIPVVSGATVLVTDSAGNNFEFLESEESGTYICQTFIPVLNSTYTLTIEDAGATYTATETLKSVPEIETVQQQGGSGFSGDDTEIKVVFTDDAATIDFYLFSIWQANTAFPGYQVTNDNFIQGNQSFGLFNVEDVEPGDIINVTFSGISEQYHNYLRILLSIAGGASGSPFQAPPVTVRGNIINLTNEADFALGYFSLSETDVREVVID